jgi:hypothetical protein
VNGRAGEHRAAVREGQQILREYGIDPLKGKENLVWAPNRGHTADAAFELVNDLKNAKASNLSRDEVIGILDVHGQMARMR